MTSSTVYICYSLRPWISRTKGISRRHIMTSAVPITRQQAGLARHLVSNIQLPSRTVFTLDLIVAPQFFFLSSHLTVESLNKISGKSISPKPLQRAMCGMYLAFRKRMRPFCALTTRRITFLWRECIWRALVADHLNLSWVIRLWQLPSECTGHGGNSWLI